jgi:micrococcal nuclease
VGHRYAGNPKRNNGQLVRPAEPFANRAKQFTSDLCQGKRVRLYLEQHNQRGKFGRLLAHVQLPDRSWLNERLLEEGLATADRRFSHSRYDHYQQLHRKSQQAKAGMWGK